MHFYAQLSCVTSFFVSEADQKSIFHRNYRCNIDFSGSKIGLGALFMVRNFSFWTPFDVFSSVILGVLEGFTKNLRTSRVKCLVLLYWTHVGPKSDVPLEQNRGLKKSARPSRAKRRFLGLGGSKVDVLLESGERATRFPSQNACLLYRLGP